MVTFNATFGSTRIPGQAGGGVLMALPPSRLPVVPFGAEASWVAQGPSWSVPVGVGQ
ncbi:MAG: hypothetical protein U0Q19_01955 [Kineosporiaceae bacterium]